MFEDRKVKAEVIAKIQAVIGDNAIFASNTSTLPITSLAAEFKDPARFIGIHFFSPVDRMMLVEIILGKETGDKALAAALDYVRAIRKTPIVVNDSRGFYANRACVGNYMREGHLMLLEGVPAAMIENIGAHGRHAGRPAVAQRRDRASISAWKIVSATEADLGAKAHRPAAEEAARGDGRKARPLRPQERQGLLRLSARQPEAAMAGPCRPAAEEARPRRDRHRVEEFKQRLLVIQALEAARMLRGKGADRRARGRRRLDPRLRLCAVLRRHAVLDRHDGHEEIRRALQEAGEEIRRALCAVEAAASISPSTNETFYRRFAPRKAESRRRKRRGKKSGGLPMKAVKLTIAAACLALWPALSPAQTFPDQVRFI